MNTPNELALMICEVRGHQWDSWLPGGRCLCCGVPAIEVLAWDDSGQLLGYIPTDTKEH
ncbi:hypothetical protein NMK54_05835 [Nocardia otitidiscaviarum]|uniref:hypothetical protein n=1 Tax=Nocardia otitidiscaviarum TaxID=1823 RepID=UPI00163DAFB6|nr:hypothetical protein [Nocardia otitidiscaviarum]MCP9619686.1 hypothetical protein [Nocardia otitidiscaviarum]